MNKNKRKILLMLVTFMGFIARILSCFWGWPHRLHPDEQYIVERAVDMINRKSWEADVYEWPGHLLVKIDSVAFYILSYLRYGQHVSDTFEQHEIFYYILARCVTCCFGAGMIIMSYLIVERLKKNAGIYAALLFAFYPVFIRHSAYATTDIPLAFLLLFIIYLSLLFDEKEDDKFFFGMCIVAGIAMTTKYPGTLFVIFPVYEAIKKSVISKRYRAIIAYAIKAIVSIFATIMLLAPNLVTNVSSVIEHVIAEDEYIIEGSVGYGFLGNLLFYVRNLADNMGIIGMILIVIGFIVCIKKLKSSGDILFISMLYFIVICSLNIQLERWGVPSFSIFMLMAALGLDASITWIKESSILPKAIRGICYAVFILFVFNVVTGGIRHVASCVVQENRVRALNYCQENGITTENSKFDGYSPFILHQPSKIKASYNDNGHLIKEENIKYYITSSEEYERFYKEPEKYSEIIKRYEAVRNDAELIKSWEEYDETSSISLINSFYNVYETVKFILGAPSGTTIKIYKV